MLITSKQQRTCVAELSYKICTSSYLTHTNSNTEYKIIFPRIKTSYGLILITIGIVLLFLNTSEINAIAGKVQKLQNRQ